MSYTPKLMKQIKAKYPQQAEAGEELLLLICKAKGVITGLNAYITSANKAVLYMRNQPYQVGEITYGMLQDSTNDYMYGVCSTNITNEKYGDYRSQFNTKMTKNVDTALKHIKKYVRPLSLVDIARLSQSDYHYKLRSFLADATNEAERKKRDVYGDELLSMVRNMYQTGHDFGEVLNSKVHDWITADKEAAEVAAEFSRTQVKFVQVVDYLDRQMLKIADCPSLKEYGFGDGISMETAQNVLSTDAPADIMGKLSALSILDDESHISGVGFKVTDDIYYVEV